MLHLLSVGFCPYGMYIVMERIVFDGARRCLIIKLFWTKNSLMSFHNIGSPSGLLLREAAC